MTDDVRSTFRRWLGVMEAIKARPQEPVRCPFCSVGTIAVHDAPSTADPTVGERFLNCPHCRRSTAARVHFGSDGPAFPRPDQRPDGEDPAAAADFAQRALKALNASP